MSANTTAMTIGVLAAYAGVGVETVRYYQRSGLMSEPVKPVNGYRRYIAQDLQRLLFIRRAKNLGFSLKDIRALLALDNNKSCQFTRDLAAARLDDLQARMKDLQLMAESLQNMLVSCDRNISSGIDECPTIDNIVRDVVGN